MSGTLLYLIHPSTLLILLFSAAIVALGTLIESILPLLTYIPLPAAIYSPTLLLTSILSPLCSPAKYSILPPESVVKNPYQIR